MRGDHVAGLSGDVQGSLDHSAGLHSSDLGIGNSQTAATVTHHRVGLMQRVDLVDASNRSRLQSRKKMLKAALRCNTWNNGRC